MSDPCAHWIALSDRQALGDALSAAERSFVAQHALTCPACAAEQGVWNDMAALMEANQEAEQPRARHSELRVRSARRRRLVWATALAACAALAFVLERWLPPRGAHGGEPALATPGVRISLTSGGDVEVDGQPARPGAGIALGSLLFARSGSACLVVERGIRACVGQGGLLRVAELSETRKRLELRAGKLAASLDPQPAGHSFGVVTREGSAVAIGTAFSVEVPHDGGAVITRVVHGTVLVRSAAGAEQRVGAHRAAPMRGPMRALSAADEAREQPLLEQAASAPRARPGSLRVASEPPGAQVFIDQRPVGVAPVALLLDPGEHALRVTRVDGVSEREVLRIVEGEELSRSFAAPATALDAARGPRAAGEAADPPAAVRGTGAAEAPQTRAAPAQRPVELRHTGEPRAKPASELLSRAREQRARGDLDGALRAYRELFAQHDASSEALAARVAYGEMLLAERGDAREALASFERYLTRGGALAREASFGRVRALRALGELQQERAALEEFLRSFPDGPLADALRVRQRALRAP